MKPFRLLMIALLAMGISGLPGCTDTPTGGMANRVAPDFTASDATKTVSLHDLRGKVVLLNFWATWCAPCIEEIPSLIRLQNRLGDKITIFAVSLDEDDAAYRKFLRDHSVTLLTVRGSKKTIDELYSPTGYPETYVVDRSGRILRKFIGPQQWDGDELVRYFTKL